MSQSYRTDPISRHVYYLRFCIFGCGYYSSNYPSNTSDKKIINIFFLRFDMINKLPLEHISIKLLLMAPFYVWKVQIFRWVYYSTASTVQVGMVYGKTYSFTYSQFLLFQFLYVKQICKILKKSKKFGLRYRSSNLKLLPQTKF